MLKIYNVYKLNSHIETLGRMQKSRGQFLNRFFLQNKNRVEDLSILLSLGTLAHTAMQAVIRRAVDAKFLKLLDNERRAYDLKLTIG